MQKSLPCIALAVGLLLPSSAARADLPGLDKQPWLGYFIGIKERKFRFGLSTKGQGVLEPLKSDGTPVATTNPIQINFDVIETMPDGKTTRKQFKDGTIASEDQPVADPKQAVTFRGFVTGDAAYEVTITPERSGVSFSGRITDKGTLTNPLHFAVSMDFIPYKQGMGDTPDDIEKFEKKVKRDEIRFESVSRERGDIEFLDEENPANAAPGGLSVAEIKTEGYGGIGFKLTSTPKSKFNFEDKGKRPLWNGFTLRWTVSEGADAVSEKFTVSAK
jgi:hypothetical protein